MRQLVKLGVSIALSLFFLYYAMGDLDTHALKISLKQIHPVFASAYVLAMMGTQLTRAWRWELLIRPFCQISFRQNWRISNVGNMLIMLLPLRLGEFARPYLLKKECGVSITASIGAVVVERVLDGLLVTLIFFLTTLGLDEQNIISPTLRVGAILALGIFSGATVMIFLTLWTHALAANIIRTLLGSWSPSLAQKVVSILDAFVMGLRSLPDVSTTLMVVFWTLMYWSINALGMFWLMRAFQWNVPVIAGFTVVCVLVIGIMIPSGPGFLGIYQAAIIAGLAVFNVPKVEAQAYSLVAWALNVAVICLFGMPYFLLGKNQLHVTELVHATKREKYS